MLSVTVSVKECEDMEAFYATFAWRECWQTEELCWNVTQPWKVHSIIHCVVREKCTAHINIRHWWRYARMFAPCRKRITRLVLLFQPYQELQAEAKVQRPVETGDHEEVRDGRRQCGGMVCHGQATLRGQLVVRVASSKVRRLHCSKWHVLGFDVLADMTGEYLPCFETCSSV
jgi:hypothetical protein